MPQAVEKVAIPPSVIGEFDHDGSKPRAGGATWSNPRGAPGKMVVGLPEVKQKAIGKVNDTVTQRILKANGVSKIPKKAKEKKAVVIPPGPGMLVAPGAPPAAAAAPPAPPPPALAGLPAGVGRQKPPKLAPAIEVEDTRTPGCCGLFGSKAPPPRPPAVADAKGDDGRGGGGSAGNSASGQVVPGAAGSSTSPAGAAPRPTTASGRGAPSLYDSTFRQANQSIKRVPQSARARSAGAASARARSAGSDGAVSNWDDAEEGEFEELESESEDDLLDDHDPREDEVTSLGPGGAGSSRQTTATGELATVGLGGGDALQASSVGPSRAGTAKSLALSTYTAASSKAPTKSILKSAASKREQSQNGGVGVNLAAVSIDGGISNGGGVPGTAAGSGSGPAGGGGAPQVRMSAGGAAANLMYGAGADGGGIVPPGYAPSASAQPTDYLNPNVTARPPGELLFGSTPPIGAGLSYVTGGGGGFYGQPLGGGGAAAGADWSQPPIAARLSGAGAGGSGSGPAAGAMGAAAAAALAPGAGAASLSAATATRPGNNMMVTAEQLLDLLMAQGKITEDDVQGVMGLGMQQQQQPVASAQYPTPPPPQTPQLQAAAGAAGAAGPNPFGSNGGSGGSGSGSGVQSQHHQLSSPGNSPDHSATNAPRFMAGLPVPAAVGPGAAAAAAVAAASGGSGSRPGPGPALATHGSLQRDTPSRVRFGVNQHLGQAPPPGQQRQLTHSNSAGPGDLPPPVAPPATAAAAAVSESVMATSPSGSAGSAGAGVPTSAAAAAARAGLVMTASQRVRFIDEAGLGTYSSGGSEANSPRGPRSPGKIAPEAMTPVEIGPGPGYSPQGVLSAASAALGAHLAPPGAGLPASTAATAAAAAATGSSPTSPPRAGGPAGEVGTAAAATLTQHGGSRSTLNPHTASSALLPGGGPPPHPVSAGGAHVRDVQLAPSSPLGPAGGSGVLQMRNSGGLSYVPSHTHAYGHSSKAPAGFAAAAAAALATPSPPIEKVGHMVAQGVAPPQGPSPMRITASGAYAGGPGTGGAAAGGGGGGGGQVLHHNTSGGSGGSASIRIGSAGSAASGTNSRSGFGGGQPAAAGSGSAAAPSHFGRKVSEAAAAAAAVAAAAGGSGGGMGAVERLAALKLQSHMRGGASAGGASHDGAHGTSGADAASRQLAHSGAGAGSKHASRGGGGGGGSAGSNWMSAGGAGASEGHGYHNARAQDAQQEYGQGPGPASRPNGGRSVRWTAAVVYEIDPGEVEDVANRSSNQSTNSGATGPAGGAGGRGAGAGTAEDGGGGRSKSGRGGGWI